MNTSNQVNVGVIGVGHLGQHHVKHFASLPNVDLKGIYDSDLARSVSIAKQYTTKSHRSIDDILSVCDAISIVTPTPQHAEVAENVLWPENTFSLKSR